VQTPGFLFYNIDVARQDHRMSKRLENMRRNPRSDWKIADVEAICKEYDILCHPVSGGGSHYKVGHPRMTNKLTIPFKRPIKPVYIRQLVKFVDAVRKLP
jgi:hypothetical protein